MPRMTDVRSIAANTMVDNVLAGKLHEFLGEICRVRLYAIAAAVGIRVSLLVGGESVVQDQEIGARAGFPIVPDDLVTEGAGYRGDRLVLSVRNTTAGAIIAQVAVDVLPTGVG